MGCKVQEIIEIMEEVIAPSRLAEDWDNVGLLVGDKKAEVNKIMVTLDVTESVVKEAIENDVDMIISHHPVIFKPLKNIRVDAPSGKLLYPLIQNNIAVYCAHTNLDKAAGGIDDTLALCLGLQDIRYLTYEICQEYYKIAVFIPKGHENAVMQAMMKEGAGCIGNYSDCSFRVSGKGTFKPLEGTNPYIGKQGRIQEVDEVRLETIVPSDRVEKVIAAMIEAHPYEEVAYDVYPLANKIRKPQFGRVGKLPCKVSLKDFVDIIKTRLKTKNVNVIGEVGGDVETVATCAGSGARLVKHAQMSGADVFVTGEIKYHDAQEALLMGITVIVAGHFATEMPGMRELIIRLQKVLDDLQYDVEIIFVSEQKDPYISF